MKIESITYRKNEPGLYIKISDSEMHRFYAEMLRVFPNMVIDSFKVGDWSDVYLPTATIEHWNTFINNKAFW